MDLEELIGKLTEIRNQIENVNGDNIKDYLVYFQHGTRTYMVQGTAFDIHQDIDITLTGTWANPVH